jgi:hypothetical protein
MKQTSYFSKNNSITSTESNFYVLKVSVNSSIKKNSILVGKSNNNTEVDAIKHLTN